MTKNFILEKSESALRYSLSVIGGISNWVKENLIDVGYEFPEILFTILTICMGLILIIIGTKITNRIAKFLLWIFGAILIIGVLYSILI